MSRLDRFRALLIGAALVAATPAHAATTYTWNAASGSWTVAANWTPVRTSPATDDILVFDGAATATPTVTSVPNETIGQLQVTGSAHVTLSASAGVIVTLSGGAGQDLAIGAGSVLALTESGGSSIQLLLPSGTSGSISGDFTVANGAHRLLPTDAGALVFETGSNCRALPGFFGNLFGNTGANGVVVFRSGSTYHQGAGSNAFGLTAPDSRIVLETGSLYRHLVGVGFAFNGRIYGDCEINTTPPTPFAGALPLGCSIDNLTVISGGPGMPFPPWTLDIKGNLTVLPGGIFDINPPGDSATVRFGGTGIQTISLQGTGARLGTYSRLEVVNPNGLTLGRYLFSDGKVALTGGHLITGPYLMHLGQVGSVAGNHWVVGNLARIMPGSAGTVTRMFEVGDAERAAPFTVSFASVSDSGTMLARADPGDHADLAASGLNPNRSVNRVWNVQNLGLAFTTCDVTLTFEPADLDVGANPSYFLVGKRDGAAWSLPPVGVRTATSTQALALTAFSDFVVADEAGSAGVDPTTRVTTALAPPRPTPSRAGVVLEYRLAHGGPIELAIYGVDGGRIRTLETGVQGAGVHQTRWDGRDSGGREVAAGVYFSRLTTADGRFLRRVVKID